MIDVEFVRRVCMAQPHTTEHVQWGADLVFKVGGKMWVVTPLEPAPVCISFKCSPDDFADLTERPGIIPAPYMARAQWVALESEEALTPAELKQYLKKSYDLVFARLSKKAQAELSGTEAQRAASSAPAARPKKKLSGAPAKRKAKRVSK
jgi:predicted DNA-binding protein (MmcQ/YjbR family)